MASQPFYHLRPNKSIDRNLFVQTLIGLTSVFPVAIIGIQDSDHICLMILKYYMNA